MKEILKVKDLSVNNNSVKILKNISFNIKKGEILGIVGESGCGKSTLIRALIQMMNKSEEIISGEILFNERNLLSLDSKQIRKLRGNNLAVIFQNPGATLNPIRKIGKQFVQTMQSHMNINKNEALEKAAAIEKFGKLELSAKAGESGKLFGTITTKKLTEELAAQAGIEIDRKAVSLNAPINKIGNYIMLIKLTSKVKC